MAADTNGDYAARETRNGYKRKADPLEDEGSDTRKHQRFDSASRPVLQTVGSTSTSASEPDAASRPGPSFRPPRPPISQNNSQENRNPVPGVNIPAALPHDKVFSIQIGTELFKLSGASISSDAPSYFSTFFEQQLRDNPGTPTRTLYIDRDPITFKDIIVHLQGYHSPPRDAAHFVKLFADAQFYSLPRLLRQIFEAEIFIKIGDQDFRIPRDIFSAPGDSPNFFTLGFSTFFTAPEEAFPGLSPINLLRPPPIHPPTVPGRSAKIFADLLYMLRGYDLHIKNEEHRSSLLRDCRYYHLKGLEQKLIKHHIIRQGHLLHVRDSISIGLWDIKPAGIAVDVVTRLDGSSWIPILYARPFADLHARTLILEMGKLDLVNFVPFREELELTKDAAAKLRTLVAAACKGVNTDIAFVTAWKVVWPRNTLLLAHNFDGSIRRIQKGDSETDAAPQDAAFKHGSWQLELRENDNDNKLTLWLTSQSVEIYENGAEFRTPDPNL